MLTIRGRYRGGRVELFEAPPIKGECEVLITFLTDDVQVVGRDALRVARRSLAREAYRLTPRETDVLQRLQHGLTNQEIAVDLDLRPGTIRNYTSSLYEKLNVRNRLEAVAQGLALGLLEPGDG